MLWCSLFLSLSCLIMYRYYNKKLYFNHSWKLKGQGNPPSDGVEGYLITVLKISEPHSMLVLHTPPVIHCRVTPLNTNMRLSSIPGNYLRNNK